MAPERLDWHDYFMNIAWMASTRSTCLRRRVGAVAVKDRRVLATGYNGAPSGIRHCLETGCLRNKLKVESGRRYELCKAVHAEQNVILQAAMLGTTLQGADLYCTVKPCIACAKMLINCGIHKIYYYSDYPNPDECLSAEDMLLEAGVEVEQITFQPIDIRALTDNVKP